MTPTVIPYLALAAACLGFLLGIAFAYVRWHGRDDALLNQASESLIAARQEAAEAVAEAERILTAAEGLKAALTRAEGERTALQYAIATVESDRDAFRERATDCQAEVHRAREAIAGLTRERDDAIARFDAERDGWAETFATIRSQRDAVQASMAALRPARQPNGKFAPKQRTA